MRHGAVTQGRLGLSLTGKQSGKARSNPKLTRQLEPRGVSRIPRFCQFRYGRAIAMPQLSS